MLDVVSQWVAQYGYVLIVVFLFIEGAGVPVPGETVLVTAAHTLVDRKQFSWSRLFVDLEAALPGVVRVKRIAVRGVATRGDQTFADLELTVVAKTPSIVTDMIAQMDQDGVFHAELRSQTLQRGRGETGAEYELAVNYRPRAGAPVDSVALSGSLAKGGDAQ